MEKKYLLVVDDDQAILKSFGWLLEAKGYGVSTAEDAREALEKACAKYYNLALIDIKLPDMEGTELLREFKQINPDMKTVMVTGYATLENAVESLNLGADGYLMKPVTPGRILEMVADKLMEQEMERRFHEEAVRDLLRDKDTLG